MSRELRNQNPENQSGLHSDAIQDLDWLAFRYVSDEMPASEREEFEKRLETDADAQSAIVDVMQSTQLIYAALDSQKTNVRPVDRSDANFKPLLKRYSALLAAAAAILLMVAGWAIFSGNQNAPGVAVNNTQNSTDLAVAWADTLTARDLMMIEAELDELADEAELEGFASDDSPEESDDWMYIALVEMQETAEVPK